MKSAPSAVNLERNSFAKFAFGCAGFAICLAGLIVLFCGSVALAQEALFLHVDTIFGTSLDLDYTNWMDVGGMQFGVARSISVSGGTGRSATPATVSPLTITKRTDASSPLLAREAAIGEGRRVDLDFVQGTTPRQRYYHIRLTDAMVSSYSQSSGGDQPVESLSFNYARFQMTYTEFTHTGTKDTTAFYDVALGVGGVSTVTQGNTPPSISSIPNTNTLQDTALTLPFTASDAESSVLTFSATTGNSGLLPVGNITFGGSGPNRTVRLLPAAGQTGTVSVTISVSDGALSASTSFQLIVSPFNTGTSNQPPRFLVSDSTALTAVAGRALAITRLQVQDPDAGTSPLSLRIVASASLTVSNTGGLSISNNGGTDVLISGSMAALNAMLASSSGLTYRPSAVGSDILNFTINDNGATGSGGPQSAQLSLPVHIYGNQFEQWQHEQFSEGELEDVSKEATLWGANADPDGDGLDNLAEYALGTDPLSANHARPERQLSFDPGNGALALQIVRRRDPGLQLSFAVSGDLGQTWNTDPAALQIAPPVDLGNGFETIRVTDSVSAQQSPRRFFRIRWTWAP